MDMVVGVVEEGGAVFEDDGGGHGGEKRMKCFLKVELFLNDATLLFVALACRSHDMPHYNRGGVCSPDTENECFPPRKVNCRRLRLRFCQLWVYRREFYLVFIWRPWCLRSSCSSFQMHRSFLNTRRTLECTADH
jgi:hypothetical protein